MTVVDFTAWVTPNLEITLGGRDYSCPPPSVAAAKIIVALEALSEVGLGFSAGPVDPALAALVESQTDPLPVLTLGRTVVDAMESGGVDKVTIERVGYYGMHYWARGKAQADVIATFLWAGEPDPKASPRRPSKSGRSTASGSRTRTAGTRTTASPKPLSPERQPRQAG